MSDPRPPVRHETFDIRQETGKGEDYDEAYSRTHRGPKKGREDIPDIYPDIEWTD